MSERVPKKGENGKTRVLFVTAEAVPYAKTGGLGDVGGSLPPALQRHGVEVTTVLPYYRSTRLAHVKTSVLVPRLEIPLGRDEMVVRVLQVADAGDGAPRVLLVDSPELFNRAGIYGELGHEYADNVFRFGVFCAAVLELVRQGHVGVDLFHVHDWQASMVPIMRATRYRDDPVVGGTPVILTVHNLEYQGLARHEVLDHLGLPKILNHSEYLEFFGRINTLKGGIVFSDFLTTVSRRYAREIVTSLFGCGLDGVLRDRRRDLVGIVNGIDDHVWDPSRDPFLTAHYDGEDPSGKALAKAALQRMLGFPEAPATPLVGFIGRMVEQKGIDLIEDALDGMMERDVQFAFLGTGQPEYERRMDAARRRWPGRIAGVIGYSEELAHRYAAGLDALLVPSRFEPCGLVQLYSLRYGTVPVVHRVGGLADTVVPVTPRSLEEEEGTGFAFPLYTPESLLKSLDRAIAHYRDPEIWPVIVKTCMQQDWSWDKSAARYEKLFRKVARERGGKPPRLTPQHRGVRVLSPRGPYLEYGPPLRERYGIDCLRLLAQSPFAAYAYFELTTLTRDSLRALAGPEAALSLVLVEEARGVRVVHGVASPVGEQWFPTVPDTAYRVEMVFTSRNGKDHVALASGTVRTPRAAPQNHVDPEWPPFPVAAGEAPPPGLLGPLGETTGLTMRIEEGFGGKKGGDDREVAIPAAAEWARRAGPAARIWSVPPSGSGEGGEPRAETLPSSPGTVSSLRIAEELAQRRDRGGP